jgi:hypothetical protein
MPRATALTFLGVKIPLQVLCFEEKNHHKVAKVKKGREKRSFVPKLIRSYDKNMRLSGIMQVFGRTTAGCAKSGAVYLTPFIRITTGK